eukprot:m.34217 g.34217  ORF g.34217 m.34217 type:complete len:375 (-) comp6505_c0_seq1:55-1179(-)
MSFLRHDMSSIDPRVTYEPSRGDPTKVRRKIQGKATSDGQYIFIDGRSEERSVPDARHKRFEEKIGVSPVGSSDFYSGNHSHDLKKENPGSFRTMFDDSAVIEQHHKQRQVNLEYKRANERRVAEKLMQREEQRRANQEASTSHLTSDPWSRTTYKPIAPGERIPRKHLDYEDVFADKDSYAAKSFGKPRTKADAKRTNEVASYNVFNTKGEDSYVAKVFGKEGFGAPKRTPSGHVQTRRTGDLVSHAIHNKSDGSTYVDQVFGKQGVGGPPKRSPSGHVAARHTNVLTNSRHHLDFSHDSYNDRVFDNGSSTRNPHKTRFQHRIQQEQSVVRHDFLDNFPKKESNARPRRLSRDPEFSIHGKVNSNAATVLKN